MKILVVEDNVKNIEAAKKQLEGHDMTIVSGYDQSHDILKAVVDLDLLGKILEKDLPNEWTADEKRVFEDGGGHWKLRSPEGKVICYWDAPKDICDVYEKAEKRATLVPFDVVLTDVLFPKGGNECMAPSVREIVRKQGEMPYGPIVALRALQIGVKRVGILTQGDHHKDPFVFAFDGLSGFQAGDVSVVCSNNMDTDDGVKNWVGLLDRLMKENED